MTDPYSVLGVSRNASMDDIKKSYRNLSRKYHPDANINNPNKAQAEEKFKEVQQAYEQIIDEKEHGTTYSSSSTGYSGAYGSGNRYSSSGYSNAQDPPKIIAAVNFCNSGHYAEAAAVLDSIPYAERNGKWYYVCAVANLGMGNVVNARDYAKIAVNMEPGNIQYQELLTKIEYGGSWYNDVSDTYGGTRGRGGNCCAELICLELILDCCCMGGNGVFCI